MDKEKTDKKVKKMARVLERKVALSGKEIKRRIGVIRYGNEWYRRGDPYTPTTGCIRG